MIKELDLVVLTHKVREYGLETGDVGTVVHCYEDKLGFEVEFVTGDGRTVAVLTLTSADIRPLNQAEILHTREVSPLGA